MASPRRLLTALALLALTAAPAASAHQLAICWDGGPGTTEQAAPKLAQFLRHLEREAGLAANAFDGSYLTDRAACERWVQDKKPALAVLDLATLLRFSGAWKLQPVAHVGTPDATRYHVLARQGTVPDLGAVAGRAVVAALPQDAAFLRGIVLDGKLDPATAKVEYTDRALRALRKVAREQADVAVVDDEAWKHVGELGLPVALSPVYSSPGLPGLTLVAVGTHPEATALAAKVASALPRLCGGDGQEMCKQLGVTAFRKAQPATFEALRAKYGR